jgi:prepilin-type N-terminal cleavage/methylation domain-containing protein
MGPLYRLRDQETGLTLIELMIVLTIIGALLAIAVTSYTGFRDRATDTAAKANVRSALPSVEAYYSDNNESYAGMSLSTLRVYDSAVTLNPLVAAKQTSTSYCISATSGGQTWYKGGPSAAPSIAPC